MRTPTITSIRAYCMGGAAAEPGQGGADYHDQDDGHWIDDHIATPMSKYPEYEDSRKSFGINVLGTLVVEIEASDGTVGFATSTAGHLGCFIVEKHLARFVEGKRVDQINLIHDQMLNATIFYSGGAGVVLNAISAVDLALWDLLGRVHGLPVHALIGGAVRDHLTFYATGPRPDLAKEMGFIGGKMPTHQDWSKGEAGIHADVERLAQMRERVGDDFWLMFDCWMSMDESYAVSFAKACEPYGLKWIEESFPATQFDSYAHLKNSLPVGMMLATGEHTAGIENFKRLLDAGVDILQPDVSWCGGLTSLLEIAALAKAYGKIIVPHGSSVYSHQALITLTNAPFCEYLMMAPKADVIRPMFDPILLGEPIPENGIITIEQLEKPGFGVELNRACPLVKPYEH